MKHERLSSGESGNPRSKTPVAITGCFRRVGSLPGDMEFTNLSHDGFEIRTQGEIAIGELIWARVRGLGPKPAVIKSREDGSYACEFNEPISRTIAYIPDQD